MPNGREKRGEFCENDFAPMIRECPDCLDKYIKTAEKQSYIARTLFDALQDALERLEASDPPNGGATSVVIDKCRAAIRMVVPDYA